MAGKRGARTRKLRQGRLQKGQVQCCVSCTVYVWHPGAWNLKYTVPRGCPATAPPFMPLQAGTAPCMQSNI